MSTNKRLVRSRSDKMIGGVCGGLGEYFGIDPTLLRIAFALLVIFGAGSPLLLYVLLWIIMPAAGSPRALIGVNADSSSATDVAATQSAPPKPATPNEPAPAAGTAASEPESSEPVAVA